MQGNAFDGSDKTDDIDTLGASTTLGNTASATDEADGGESVKLLDGAETPEGVASIMSATLDNVSTPPTEITSVAFNAPAESGHQVWRAWRCRHCL